MTTDTLLERIYEQNDRILDRINSLEQAIALLQGNQPDPDDVWATGIPKLREALIARGLQVSEVRLKRLRAVDVLRASEDDDLEARNIGTPNSPRWRFHVGRSKEAILWFESLPVDEQRRILG